MVRCVRADRKRQPMAIHNRHDFMAKGGGTGSRLPPGRSRSAMAFGQSHRVRTSPAGFCQKKTRSGIRDHGQPQCTAFKGCKPRQNIQQFSALTVYSEDLIGVAYLSVITVAKRRYLVPSMKEL